MSLWKPRTKPGGFEGVGETGIPWMREVAEMGLIPATEVMDDTQADTVINQILKEKTDARVMIWLGSRNQNHAIQQRIGEVIRGTDQVMLLIKNQPWKDESHWKGIVEHVVHGGADPNQIILCHRGFAPGDKDFRNTPDFTMAMRIKNQTGLPMVIDPSHIGGSVEKVVQLARDARNFRENGVGFDGLMIEVHPEPTIAQTDAKQQMTWSQFDTMNEDVVFQA
jgi:chorismate mutase